MVLAARTRAPRLGTLVTGVTHRNIAHLAKIVATAEAVCYPRPLQEKVPILVGGSGERRRLRLVARHADACNLFGDPATVRRKVAVLHLHCASEGRDPAEITVTIPSTADAPTVEDHVGRYRQFAEAGVQTAIVSVPHLGDPAALTRFGEVIQAFRP